MIKPLRGANAIITGGSQGLGLLFARALAERGLNLALAARSAEKLEGIARELSGPGARVVALPADITQAADRERLVVEAEKALGPIDLLINNAGVELNSRFARKPPAEIELIYQTNVIAPSLLTRRLLPGMLERRRGHIVNMGSIAGKIGTPYGSVYGASKAAVMAWSWALRVELEGTGVSVSTVVPGLVSETGFFAHHQTRPHFMLGEIAPTAVVSGLLRALERDLPEVVVDPRFFWTYQVTNVFAPGFLMYLNRLTGVRDWLRRTYDRE